MGRPEPLLAVMRRQHVRIAALVDAVMTTGETRRPDAVRRLLAYLALHESAEQSLVHPLGLAVGVDVSAVRQRVAEEHEISAVVSRLERLDCSSVDFMIQFGLLDEALRAHVEAEERVEVPAIAERASPHDLDRIADSLALVDSWYEALMRRIVGWGARSYDDLSHRADRAFTVAARNA